MKRQSMGEIDGLLYFKLSLQIELEINDIFNEPFHETFPLLQLTQMGYTNLTAIDAAREFLSKSGDVYKTKHLMYLGPDTKKHIQDGKGKMIFL